MDAAEKEKGLGNIVICKEMMTEEQRESYDRFIDCMADLYLKYGHLLDEEDF